MADRIIKLALWHTKTFTPIMSHEELESIMATLGFAPLPVTKNPCNIVMPDNGSASSNTLWKEYFYSTSSPYKRSSDPPRPKLPYPVIDGLHVCTYQAFLDSVNFYRSFDDDLSHIFHIRGMTLHRIHDKRGKWSRMEESNKHEANMYVYREGLYDISTHKSWKANVNDVNFWSNKSKRFNAKVFNSRSNILAGCIFVPMKDIVVQSLTDPNSSFSNNNKGEQYTNKTR